MSKAALTLYMYGLYLITGVCLPFLIIPEFTLGLFSLSAGDGFWVRFTGVLAGVIGGFYIAAVLTGTRQVFAWSVPARYASATFMGVAVLVGKVGIGFLLFCGLDALTGTLTWLALRADAADARAADLA
jgi:hypothetical protein